MQPAPNQALATPMSAALRLPLQSLNKLTTALKTPPQRVLQLQTQAHYLTQRNRGRFNPPLRSILKSTIRL